MSMKFGPAGNGRLFTESGFKHTFEAPKWLSEMGLSAYEYQCGRGVNISDEGAEKIRVQAEEFNITMSLHSPYFINLSSADSERAEKNIGYILASCKAVRGLGGKRIVVHCGGLSKMEREEAGRNTQKGLEAALKRTEEEGYGDILLCLETMGKVNVYGTLEEVCNICRSSDRLIPCVDFGHLNARTLGGLSSKEDFVKLFDTMENIIGTDKAKMFHSHFSKIEYSKGGEVRHLTLEDTIYGPEFYPAAEIMAKRGYNATVICESSGTQAEDAVSLMNIYNSIV